MSKQLKKLVITTGVVVVLAVACAVLLNIPQFKNATASSESSGTSSDSTIQLFSSDSSKISKVVVSNQKGGYSIVQKKSGDFTVPELANAPLDSSTVSSAADTAASITATEIIKKDADNLSDYGLDKPKATVAISTTTGKNYTFEIGNASPSGDGYYIKEEGKNTVYFSEISLDTFLDSKTNFIDASLVSVSTDDDLPNISTIQFGGSKRQAFDIKVNTTEAASSTSSGTTTKTVSGFEITSPIAMDGDTDNIDAVFTALSSLSASNVVSLDTSESSLKKYGLSDPYYTFSYNLKGATTKLLFGKSFEKSGTQYVYVMLDGRKVVYDIEESSVSFYKDQLSDLSSRLLLLPQIDTVASMVITKGSESWKFTLSGESDNLVAKYGSTTLKTDYFRHLYQDVIGVEMEGAATRPDNNTPYLTVTFNYRATGTSPDVVKYYQMDATKCFVSINGKGYFYVLKSDLDQLVKNVRQCVKGQDVPT